MEEDIEDEVGLMLNNENEYIKYKEDNLHVGVVVSFHMGWNKCSSGNRYYSLTGRALMIGCISKNIITAIVCRTYSLSEENGEELPYYVCPKNYDSSSKAMETDAALHLY